jgi:glycosyltransferase involved in cell wall biosynthesis
MTLDAPADTPFHDLHVLHIGPGSYQPHDRGHSTYAIWHALASGFRRYDVVGRSTAEAAEWTDGALTVRLFRRNMERELEFLWKQYELVALGRSLRPDVVVCQSPVLGGLAGLRIARETGAGILMEIHGNEYLVDARPGSRNWLLQQISRYALRRASLIRVLSEGMKERLLQRYGAGLAGKVRVLPPRVDLDWFEAKSRPATLGPRLRAIMVGAVNANKGQLRLIRALRRSQLPVELHIVGDGPDLEECRVEAARASSSLSIVCHGAHNQRRVAELLQDCFVFVMYSKSVGTPSAMMEAMATGLPVVTTDAGFCADVVRHGVEGIVLGSDPDKEIIDVLDSFFELPEVPRHMGLAARARAERDYDAVVLFDRYRSLIADAARR